MKKGTKNMKDNLFDKDNSAIEDAMRNPFAALSRVSYADMAQHFEKFVGAAISVGVIPEDYASTSGIATGIIEKLKSESIRRSRIANQWLDVSAALIRRETENRENDRPAVVLVAKQVMRELSSSLVMKSKNTTEPFTVPGIAIVKDLASRNSGSEDVASDAVDIIIETFTELGVIIEADPSDVQTLNRLITHDNDFREEKINEVAEKHFGARSKLTAKAFIAYINERMSV